MLLPDADADVDIDDLIEDDDDDEAPVAGDDLTTDEDEQRPTTSSSSSPPPAERVDDEASVTDRVAAADSETKPTSPTPAASNDDDDDDDDDVSEDKTSELTESQANTVELQSNECQQQQPTINADDVDQLITDNTGTRDVDLPEPSLTTSELQTQHTDTSRLEGVAEIVSQGESPEAEDTNNLAEKQQETFNDGVDTPDSSQQVCQSTAAESTASGDVIPPTSLSASATVLASLVLPSPEQPQHADVVIALQQEPPPTPKDQEHDEENDMKSVPENEGQTETQQHRSVVKLVTDQNEQNDLQVTSQSELEVNGDQEPDSSATQTKKGRISTTSTTEEQEQEQGVHVETQVDLEKQSSSSAEKVTSPQDAEGGHEEVQVTEDSEVTEQATVTEEVKVTYEASAKQLDLLSRLAMLREKAAQRKTEQPSDTESTQDSQPDTVLTHDSRESLYAEDHGLSRQTGDSSRPQDQSDSPQQQQDDILTKNDVNRSSVDVNKDKEASPETDKQRVVATVNADAEQQHRQSIESPSQGTAVMEDKSSLRGQLVSRTDGHCRSTGSSSVTTHNDVVETEVLTMTTDNCLSTAEQLVSLPIDKPSTQVHSQLQAAEASNIQSTTTHSGLDSSDVTSTKDADLKIQSEPDAPVVSSADTHQQDDEVACSFAATDSSVELQATKRDLHQPDLTQTLSDTRDGELSNASTSADSCSVTDTITEHSTEPTHLLDDVDDTAVNYDSDLDREFAVADALQLLSDVQSLKSRKADGPGYLYVFGDAPKKRLMIGASMSPAKRLRQAIVFNPDITLLIHVPVSRRLAAVTELRRRLVANHSCDVIAACLPQSRDWFTGSDDVMTEVVKQVAADDTTN